MNPVYSPGSSGVPYANAKGVGYPAGFPMGYAAAAPAYSPSMYPGASPAFQTGYAPGTPYKVSCSPTSGAVPPYSSSPTPYQTAVYPVRSAYPQQSPYAQVAGRLLRPAPVRSAPARHPPHHRGAAQRHAGDRVPRSRPSTTGQWGRHGHGGRDHDGHVSRYPADGPLPDSCRPPPSHRAHVPGSRNAHLQLRSPTVVITANVQDGAGRRVSGAPQPVLQASRLDQDSPAALDRHSAERGQAGPVGLGPSLQLTVGGS